MRNLMALFLTLFLAGCLLPADEDAAKAYLEGVKYTEVVIGDRDLNDTCGPDETFSRTFTAKYLEKVPVEGVVCSENDEDFRIVLTEVSLKAIDDENERAVNSQAVGLDETRSELKAIMEEIRRGN
jgi:hypothetical protein